MMGNKGALFRLNGIMVADLDQRLDHMIESVYVIVMQDQVPHQIPLAISLVEQIRILSGNISGHGLLLRNAKIENFIHKWRKAVNKVPIYGQIQ
jgi:hypothetical protein